MDEIAKIEKISVVCRKCESEVTFKINAHNEYNSLYNCPICGNAYGIDPEDNPIVKAGQVIGATARVKGAVIGFVCRGDEE